jgi:predicted metal-dependent phosphoesterase TrpH
VRVKGALHVHSTLSHDGTLTIAELVDFYKHRGYDFIALGEHSQDMDDGKIELMRRQSAEHSQNTFCVIPGIEYSCRGGIHLFAAGAGATIADTDSVAVAAKARAIGAFVILAHPSRIKWECPANLVKAVDAAEIWNVAYDGKYLPSFRAPAAFRQMRGVNPKIFAAGGQDFHRKPAFYDLAVYVETDALTPDAIMAAIHRGNYEIRSRFFRFDADAEFSSLKVAALSVLSWQLAILRRARDSLRRWAS